MYVNYKMMDLINRKGVAQALYTSVFVSLLVHNALAQNPPGCVDIDPNKRAECGYNGIDEIECHERDCCWDSTVNGSRYCFQTPACAVDPEFRLECGYGGITVEECLKRGCCHQVDDNARHCYQRATANIYQIVTEGKGALQKFRATIDDDHMTFQLKAPSNANLALITNPDDANPVGYTVLMGLNDNKDWAIRDGLRAGDIMLIEESLVDELSDTEYRDFWVSWANQSISVGKGQVVGVNELMSYPEVVGRVVSIGVETESDAVGRWRFARDRVRTAFMTYNFRDPSQWHGDLWLTESQKQYLIFGVQAEKDVFLALSYLPEDETETNFIIYIGLQDETQEGIRKCGIKKEFGGEVVVDIDCTNQDLVSIFEMRFFWLAWYGDTIRIGKGRQLEQDEILSHSEALPDLKAVALYGYENEVKYEVRNIAENSILVTSMGQDSYLTLPHSQEFSFRLRGCRGGFIYLKLGGVTVAEVVIAENDALSRVNIYDNNGMNPTVTDFNTLNLLSCNEFRNLWLTWRDGEIKFGKGVLGENLVFNMIDPHGIREVETLEFVNAFSEHTLEWEFTRDTGYLFETATQEDEPVWITVEEVTSIILGTKICKEAEIVIGTYVGNFQNNLYKFVLAVNDMNEIIVYKDNNLRDSKVIPGFINCDAVTYIWVSWENGILELGEGQTVSNNLLISYLDSENPYPVRAIGLSSKSVELWVIPNTVDYVTNPDLFQVKTESVSDSFSYGKMQAVVSGDEFFFSLKAEKECQVCMLYNPAIITGDAGWCVTIGGDDNANVKIREGVDNGKPHVTTNYSNILSADEFRDFWITWSGNNITFGSGTTKAPENKLASCYSDTMRSIDFVSVTVDSNYEVDGYWKFRRDDVRQLFYKYNSYGSESLRTDLWVAEQEQYHTVIAIKGCKDAKIGLGRYFDDFADPVFVLTVGEKNNMETTLRSSIDSVDPILTVPSQDILSCDETRYFWIQWQDRLIKFGKGGTVGRNIVLSHTEALPHDILALTMYGQDDTIQFEVRNHDTEHWLIKSQNTDNEWDNSYLNIHNIYHFVFKVKACKGAVITFRNVDTKIAEIILGVDQYLSTITWFDGKGAHTTTDITALNLLDCTASKQFWINWHKDGSNTINLGRKGVVDAQHIATVADPWGGVRQFTSLHLSAMDNSNPVEWEFDIDAGSITSLRTRGGEHHHQAWISTGENNMIVFKITGCENAWGLFTTYFGQSETNIYEIGLGLLNTRTVIKKDYIEKHSVDTPDLLSCTEGRYFWAAWEKNTGVLRAGKGLTPYQDEIISWTDTDENKYEINAISLASSLGDILWEFYTPTTASTTPEPDYYYFRTNGDYRHEEFLATTELPYVVFEIKAESQTQVALLYNPENVADRSWGITIGGEGNKFIKIRRCLCEDTAAIKEIPGLLNETEYRPFWISWENHNISVGTGREVGQNVLLWYHQDTIPEFAGAAFDTRDSYIANWRLRRGDVREAWITYQFRDASIQHGDVWVTSATDQSVVLGITGSSEAKLALTKSPEDESSVYVIMLGVNSNTMSTIKFGFGGIVLVSADTPNILSPDETRYFWVSWKDNVLAVGSGHLVGSGTFMDYREGLNHTIQAVTLYGLNDTITYHLRNADENTFLLTSMFNPGDTSSHQVNVVQQTEFNFKLRGCRGGVIQFKTALGVGEVDAVTLVLGYDEAFSNVTFRADSGTGTPIASYVETPQLMSCYSYRPMWVSWKNGFIAAGVGEDLLGATFLNISDPFGVRTFVSLHFSNWNTANPVEWQLSKSAGQSVSVRTPPKYESDAPAWLTVADVYDATFSVDTCYAVYVSLGSYIFNDRINTYQLYVSNENSTIRKDGAMVHTVETPSALQCSNPNPLWVSWKSNILSIGSGLSVGSYPLVSYTDTSNTPYEITAIGVESEAWTTWEFREGGEAYVIYTGKTNEYERFWMSTHRQTLSFSVKACRHARVALSETFGDAQSRTYEVYIDNNKIEIRDTDTAQIVVNTTTTDLLSCTESRTFWIGWKQLHIAAGIGIVPFQHQVVALHPLEEALYQVSAVGLRTGVDVEGVWTIDKYAGSVVRVKTMDEYSYNSMWLSTGTRTDYVFEVKTTADAHILLSTMLSANTSTGVYEIVLGGGGNTKSWVRNATNGENLGFGDTPDILSPDEYRSFWVSWRNGFIRAGKGHLVGVDEVVNWQADVVKPIQALAVSNWYGSTAFWQLTNYDSEIYMVATEPGESYDVLSVKTRKEHLQFKVAACKEVKLLLSQEVNPTDTSIFYEVGIGYSDNNKIVLVDTESNGQIAEMAYPDALSCNTERPYWVSWMEGILKVGVGYYPDGQLLQLVDGSPHVVNSISMHSTNVDDDIPGHWQIAESEVETITVKTKGTETFRKFSMIASSKNYLVFSLRATGHAWIMLNEISGQTNTASTHIGIGVNAAHDHNVIRYGGTVMDDSTEHLINFNREVVFWIGWENDNFRLGLGASPGSSFILSWKHTNPHRVNSISFSTTNGLEGYWSIRQLQGNVYGVVTAEASNENRIASYQQNWFAPLLYRTYYEFQVAACQNAHIALGFNPRDMSSKVYEVTLSYKDGNKYHEAVIKDYINGNRAHQTEAQDTSSLDCNTYKRYWVSWTSGLVTVGRESYPSYQLLAWTPPEEQAFTVNFVALSVGPESASGQWELYEPSVDMIKVSADGDRNYKRFWVSVTDRNALVFSVKACGHVTVALSSVMYNTRVQTYEMDIQNSENKTKIKHGVQGTEEKSVDSPGLLHCDHFRSFWLSWQDGVLKFGRSSIINDASIIIQHTPTNSYSFAGISLSSASGHPADFYIVSSQTATIRMFPPQLNSYEEHKLFMQQNYASFRVRACEDARMAISPTDDVDGWLQSSYEIIIGAFGNTKIGVYSNKTTILELDIQDLLDCDEYRRYWISWYSSILTVGSGSPFDNSIAAFIMNKPPTFMAVTAQLAPAQWELDYVQGETYMLKTTYEKAYNTSWVMVTGFEFTTFSIKACANAHLALAAIPGNFRVMCYELVIGSFDNTESMLKSGVGVGNAEENLQVQKTPNILNCTAYLPFWLSWSDSTIRVGTGSDPSQGEFINFLDDNYHLINAIGLSTGYDSPGEWVFGDVNAIDPTDPPFPAPGFDDDIWMVKSVGDSKYERVHFTVMGDNFKIRLKACSDVWITISKLPGIFSSESYILRLGVNGNTESTITRTGTDIFEQNYQTPDLLSCDEFRDFWVSWDLKKISFGKGAIVGTDQQGVFSEESYGIEVNSISLTSAEGVTADLQFLTHQGVTYTLLADSEDLFDQYKLTRVNHNYLSVQIQMCNDAYIVLEADDGPLFQVMIGLTTDGQTVSVITDGSGNTLETAQTPAILDCDSYRPFWIRWDQTIEVGHGMTVGADAFLSYTNDEIPDTISAVRLANGPLPTPGFWKISNIEENTFIIRTPNDFPYKQAWILEDKHYIEFTLKACSDHMVYLGESVFVSATDRNGIMVVLGENGNTGTTITRYPDNLIVASNPTSGVLDCHTHRLFWISWYPVDSGIEIKVGTGKQENDFVFASYVDFSPFSIRTLTMGARDDSEGIGEWTFPLSAGESTILLTPKEYTAFEYMRWLGISGLAYHVQFKVKACSEAHIFLSPYMGIGSVGYKITIGGVSNSMSQIVDKPSDTILDENSEERLLSCSQSKWFWISWLNGVIRVGKGSTADANILLEATMTTTKTVEGLGFYTSDTDGEWEFTQVEDRTMDILVPNVYSHTNAYVLTHGNSLQFRVKAKQDARVLLMQNPGWTTELAYEFRIGAHNNTRTELYKITQDGVLFVADADSPFILQEDTLMEFWITWYTTQDLSILSLGRGSTLAKNTFISYNDTVDVHQVNAVSFSTTEACDGEFVISDNSGFSQRFKTEGIYKYERLLYRVASINSVVFKVKICSDAHVGLLDVAHTDRSYEIVLGAGGNTYSSIRIGKLSDTVFIADTINITSCDEYRTFWMSWDDGFIQVGYGGIVGYNEFMYWQDTDPQGVAYLAISGWDSVGDWEFLQFEDEVYYLETIPGGGQKDQFIYMSSGQDTFTFGVTACAEAHIHLHESRQTRSTYRFFIGTQENQETHLYKGGDLVYSVATPDILHCTQRKKFWITWSGGLFQLSLENANGRKLVQYQDDSPIAVFGYSTTSGQENYASFSVPVINTQGLRFTADHTQNYQTLWRTTATAQALVFLVQANAYAYIVLAESPGSSLINSYDIQLGMSENSKTVIFKHGYDLRAEEDTPDILSGDEMREFWVRWSGGLLEVGYGGVIGANSFIVLDDTEFPLDINAFTVAAGYLAEWYFPGVIDNLYILNTDDQWHYRRIWITPERNDFSFGLQTCMNGHVFVGSEAGNIDVGYEVLLGGYSNTVVEIWDGVEGDILATKAINGTTDCDEIRTFWIQWTETSLTVGTGSVPGTQDTMLLEYTSSSVIHQINAISMCTNVYSGVWDVTYQQQKAVDLYLPQLADPYDYHWATVFGYTSINFRVRACMDVKIVLSEVVGRNDFAAPVFILGSDGNANTVLRAGLNGEVLSSVPTSGIISCNEFRSFWVSWDDMTYRIGNGYYIGEYVILSHQVETQYQVAAVGFSTSENAEADWQISKFSEPRFSVSTMDNKEFGIMKLKPTGTSVKFRVRANQEAQIFLGSDKRTEKYKFIIGAENNMKTVLYKTNSEEVLTFKNTPYILDPDEYRPFWVSWTVSGELSLGSGTTIGKNIKLDHFEVAHIPIEDVEASTYLAGTGNWEIAQSPGDQITIYTDPDDEPYTSGWYSVLDTNYLVFWIRAASDARIAITKVSGVTAYGSVEVVIGANDNTRTYIKDPVDGPVYGSTDTVNILSNSEFRAFWVSWIDNHLKLGSGETVGYQEITSYSSFKLPTVSSVSVASGGQSVAEWMFKPESYLSTTTTTDRTTTTERRTTTTDRTTTHHIPRTTTTEDKSTTTLPNEGAIEATGGLSSGDIVGIVFGVIVGLAILGVVGFFVVNKMRGKSRDEYSEKSPLQFENSSYNTDDLMSGGQGIAMTETAVKPTTNAGSSDDEDA